MYTHMLIDLFVYVQKLHLCVCIYIYVYSFLLFDHRYSVSQNEVSFTSLKCLCFVNVPFASLKFPALRCSGCKIRGSDTPLTHTNIAYEDCIQGLHTKIANIRKSRTKIEYKDYIHTKIAHKDSLGLAQLSCPFLVARLAQLSGG